MCRRDRWSLEIPLGSSNRTCERLDTALGSPPRNNRREMGARLSSWLCRRCPAKDVDIAIGLHSTEILEGLPDRRLRHRVCKHETAAAVIGQIEAGVFRENALPDAFQRAVDQKTVAFERE